VLQGKKEGVRITPGSGAGARVSRGILKIRGLKSILARLKLGEGRNLEGRDGKRGGMRTNPGLGGRAAKRS